MVAILIVEALLSVRQLGLFRVTKRGLLLVSGWLFVCDVIMLALYGFPVDRSAIAVVLDTNRKEASEFLVHLVDSHTVMPALGVFFTYLVKKLSNAISPTVWYSALLCLVLVPVGSSKEMVNSLSVIRFPNMLLSVIRELSSYHVIDNAISSRETVLTRNNSRIPHVLVILGESLNRNHLQVYGYNKSTTPFLYERGRNNETVLFTDLISAHAHTLPSLRALFSFYRDEGDKPWYTYNTLMEVLNCAGYHTSWISNQELSGHPGNPARIYSKLSSERAFSVIRDSSTANASPFDGELIPILKALLEKQFAKTFVVLHFYGAHIIYKARYPQPLYARWNRSDYGDFSPLLTPHMKETIAHYDNTIYYLDDVVEQAIRLYASHDSMILYTSDHGEEVYDNPEHPDCGHSEYTVMNKGSRWQVEIPFVVWLSPKLRTRCPTLRTQLQERRHVAHMNNDLIHSILDILDIQTADFDSSKSLFNEAYQVPANRKPAGRPYTIIGG